MTNIITPGRGREAAPRPAYRGGGEWAGASRMRAPFEGALTGPGLAQLDDWLKETPEGRAIVTLASATPRTA